MRAWLLPLWPALSEIYGLHPTDVDALAPAEWAVYVEALADRAREQERQRVEAARARRR